MMRFCRATTPAWLSFPRDAPRPFLPFRLHRPRLRSKCEEGRRTAFRVGFTDAKSRVGEEVAASDGEARDLQECLDGRGGGLLHLPAAGV